MSESPFDPRDLPFDQYGRHRIVQRVAECIRACEAHDSLRVLDVGGFPGLMPRFLEQDTVVVTDVIDPSALRPGQVPLETANYLRADGSLLPFTEGSFDLVISLDSLEHVPQARREMYVAELIRVSRGYVLLIAPFAQAETELAERLLAAFVRVVNQEEQPQLEEHRANGLPDLKEWESYLHRRGLAHISFSSGFVHNWLPMMLLKHYVLSLQGAEELHRSIDRFYNETLLESDAQSPGYRQGLLISNQGPSERPDGVLERMGNELGARGEVDRLAVLERMERIGLLLKIADLHVSSRRDDRLREEILDKERHILNLEAALGEAERNRALMNGRIEALEQELRSTRAHLDDIRGGKVMRALDTLHRLRSR